MTAAIVTRPCQTRGADGLTCGKPAQAMRYAPVGTDTCPACAAALATPLLRMIQTCCPDCEKPWDACVCSLHPLSRPQR